MVEDMNMIGECSENVEVEGNVGVLVLADT